MGKKTAMAAAINESKNFYQLVRNTLSRQMHVSEMFSEFDGLLIHSQERQTEHFREQFSWPSSA